MKIRKISRFFIRHNFANFSTLLSKNKVQLTITLLIKLSITPLNSLNPDLYYECKLQNSIQINKTFLTKIIFFIHDVFAVDRLFKQFYIFELFSSPIETFHKN